MLTLKDTLRSKGTMFMGIPSVGRTETVILAALSRGEQYGLEIAETVRELTKGKIVLPIGGLYTTLHRLEKKGLVRGRWGETSEARRGARRRYYTISGLGERTLKEGRDLARALAFAVEGAR